ncbi:MAG: hypothetical protein WBA00_13545 [Rhodococcus sp. (in: high G+C Gram-positive bacteria)]
MSPTPDLPRWQFASDDLLDRYVVVTDADMLGWSVHYQLVEGDAALSAFTSMPAEREQTGTIVVRDGASSQVWAARIETAALLISMQTPDGQVVAVDPWDAMVAWLTESIRDESAGLIVDLGPNTDIPDDEIDDFELVTAQMHLLDDGVVLVRRSRRLLHQLRLVDHSARGLELDRWHHDQAFDDCTDGYLFTRDAALAAAACVAWVRDTGGVEAADRLGCSFDFADELPRRG